MPKRALSFIAAPAVAATALLGVATVSAADEPIGQCQGSTPFWFPGVAFDSPATGAIVSDPSQGFPISRTIAASLPAGTYDVDTFAYDGSPDRHIHPQLNEQYHLEILDADGVIIAETGTTADVPDTAPENTWAGSVGRVELDRPATQIRAMHSYPAPQDTLNSVFPTCVGFELVPPPTTTTQPPTTTTTEPPTTTAPPTTEPPVTTAPPTTAPPTTMPPTTMPPTTTVPTEVLGIQQSPPATPVTVTPTFTG